MTDTHGSASAEVDSGTIGWLLPEISTAFDQALTALRQFRAGAAGAERRDVDLGPLRIARSHLHQAHGALQVVDLAGVSRVTEAVEELVATFEGAPERCDATSLDAIGNACRSLLEYLEDLRGDSPPQPLFLFPCYRDLLVARGVERIHPADLFQANLAVRPTLVPGRILDSRALAEQRATFEQALLRYMRNESDTGALHTLVEATGAIEASVAASSKQNQQRAFWWVARAFFEAIANGGLAQAGVNHADVKRLAGRINLQIRRLVEGAPAIAERLFLDTLFFVAASAPVTQRVRDVQEAYGLEGTIPRDYDRQRYGLVDTAALARARDVLGEAKTAWSAVVGGDVEQIKGFSRVTGSLLDAVSPLKRRGLVDVAQIVDGIATDLTFDPRRPAPNVGLDVATALLFLDGALQRARSLDDEFDQRAAAVVARVEAAAIGSEAPAEPVEWLDRLSREAEERLTMATFVAELQTNLRQAEKVLDAFFRDTNERAELDVAIASLKQVSGALALLGHVDAHRAVDVSRETIEQFKADPAATDPAAFQRIASNLGAVGFYVDQLKRERIEDGAFRFDAEEGVFSAEMARAPSTKPEPATLEVPELASEFALDFGDTPQQPTLEMESVDLSFEKFEDPALSYAVTQILEQESTLEEQTARHGDDATLLAAEFRLHPEDDFTRTRLVTALEEVQRNAALIDDRSLQADAAEAVRSVRDAGRDGMPVEEADALTARIAEVASQAQRAAGTSEIVPVSPSAPIPSNTEAVDAELLEIFLEEAQMVLADVREPLRLLDADPANTTAMTVLRRAFHTLKGSGRMVGLTTFGEAAWAIEETLNEFLADQVAAPTDLRSLIDYAARYLGDWAEDLRASGHSSRVPDALIEAARAVRHGAKPALPPGLAVVAAPAPDIDAVDEPTVDAPVELAFDAPGDDFAKTLFLPSGTPPPVSDPAFAETQFAATQFAATQFASTQFVGDLDRDEGLLDIEFFGQQPELPNEATLVLADLADDHVEVPTDPIGPDARTGAEDDAFAKTMILEDDDGFAKTMLFADDVPTPMDEPRSFDAEPLVFEDLVIPRAEPVAEAMAAEPEPEVEAHAEVEAEPEVVAPRDETRQIGPVTLSVALFNIYLGEADERLRVLTLDFAEWREELDRFVSEGAMRAAHSLAGSSSTVGLAPVHDLAAGIEEVLQQIWREPTLLSADQVEQLQDAVETMRKMLHRFAAERMPEDDHARVAALRALRDALIAEVASTTPEPVAEFADIDPVVEPTVEPTATSVEPVDAPTHEALDIFGTQSQFGEAGSDSLHDPIAEAETAPVEPVAEPAADLQAETPAPADEPSVPASEPELFNDTSEVTEHDQVMADALAEFVPEALATESPVSEPQVSAPEASPWQASDLEASDLHADEAIVDMPIGVPLDAIAVMPTPHGVERTVRDEIDTELLDVFIAEGNEILPQISALLRQWQGDTTAHEPARLLLRHLHTLKGSARMAGAMRLGEVVHDLEARVESAQRLHEIPTTLLEDLMSAHDRSLELFDELGRPAEAAAPAPVAVTAHDTVEGTMDAAGNDAVADVAGTGDAARPGIGRTRDTKDPRQQAVRVSSETLDRLVNLAGEVSITRARIENEVMQVRTAVGELAENVERLRGQLREIELQAEFQMQSRMQSQSAADESEKFDPLEFDRFTRFQELTRMMAESVNDVKTLQQNLQKNLETADIDLSSQRRMTRDLQQDLMSVRMVPFANVSERLYRVARRAAKEVDKRVNLDIRGGSVEIDRSVLERMAGAFEHLLRNHIAHGIESRATRRAAGKSETGELLVEVRQEGNEIVLTFSDDGAGIDHERIREKVRALGLAGPDEALTDAAAAEYIFHPGFSTASEVTELAGRGIGMDVVRSEAATLGGRVAVDSERGRGTRFTITLPLTLAITQVVLVSVAGRVFALPAVLVEQVRQLRSQPLAEAYRAGHVDRAGESVRIVFLGALLDIEQSVPVAQRLSPVLMLRSANESLAVHVDEVVANQEVVVKTLGPQLARMTGIAGATVLGSGEIVLILNPVQIAQTFAMPTLEATAATAPAVVLPEAPEGLQTLPTVMVVDDSLTVRRVTQRLLSREGYQVVLAKDGVDALEQLQEYAPDVMLVDIEMPRMDGFDLTRHVRADDRLKHIPIVMITSRTANKHRDHALALGVDEYLGKPYQEEELLELLATHVKSRRTQAA